MIIAEYTATASQSINTGAVIPWVTTAVSPCDMSIRHRANSGTITLKAGRYFVDFGAGVSVATAGAEASLALALDGEAVTSSTMIATSSAANDVNSVSASLIVDVPCCCCTKLSVINTGTLATAVQDANIIIMKVG